MAESSLLPGYMAHTRRRLSSGLKPVTVGTYCASVLQGNAKRWMGRYAGALERSLIKAGWVSCASQMGRWGFRPPSTEVVVLLVVGSTLKEESQQ